MCSWRWLGLVACCALACGEDPATAVIVQVRADAALAARGFEVGVRLGHGEGAQALETFQQTGEEAVFTLSQSTKETRFELDARVLDGAGAVVATQVVQSVYVEGEVRVLLVVVEEACASSPCVAVVGPDGLCPFVGEPLGPSCGVPADAAIDASFDMQIPEQGIDGGVDAEPGDADVPDMNVLSCASRAAAAVEVESECILPFQDSESLIVPPVEDRCETPSTAGATTGCADGQTVDGCDGDGLRQGMFGGGEGSAEQPFVICDPRQLHAYLTRDGTGLDGSHVRVVCDLDMTGRPIDATFEPPSLRGGSFRGACGGGANGLVRIQHLFSSRTFSNALFGELADGAEVGDLLFDDLVVCGEAPDACETQAAGVALAASNSAIENVHIRRGTIRARRGSQLRARAAGIVGDLGGRYGREEDFAAGEFFPRCLPTVLASNGATVQRVSIEGQVVAEFDEADLDGTRSTAGIASVARPGTQLSQLLVQGVVSGVGRTAGLIGTGTERSESALPVVNEAVVRAVVFAGRGGRASGVSGGRGTFRNVLFHGAVYTLGDRAAGFVGENLTGPPPPGLSNAIVAATVNLGSAGQRGSVHAFTDFAPATTNVRFASECFSVQVPAAAVATARTPPVGTLAEPDLGDIGRGVFATEPWVAVPDSLPTLTFVEGLPALPPWSDTAAASYVNASDREER